MKDDGPGTMNIGQRQMDNCHWKIDNKQWVKDDGPGITNI